MSLVVAGRDGHRQHDLSIENCDKPPTKNRPPTNKKPTFYSPSGNGLLPMLSTTCQSAYGFPKRVYRQHHSPPLLRLLIQEIKTRDKSKHSQNHPEGT